MTRGGFQDGSVLFGRKGGCKGYKGYPDSRLIEWFVRELLVCRDYSIVVIFVMRSNLPGSRPCR